MRRIIKIKGWYSVSFVGGLMMSLYGTVPLWMIYMDSLGLLSVFSRSWAIGGMILVTACAGVARSHGHRLFRRHKKDDRRSGFTLIELLIVISIIGILSGLILPTVQSLKKKAYVARAQTEFRSIAVALELYTNNYGSYPPDANRDIPPGLEAYLAPGNWPQAPWPNSLYDWDSWAPGDLTYEPKQQVYQISIRYCPTGQPTQCTFPNEPWAQNFDYYSAAYFCLSGPCRAHSSQPPTHPGYCMNC